MDAGHREIRHVEAFRVHLTHAPVAERCEDLVRGRQSQLGKNLAIQGGVVRVRREAVDGDDATLSSCDVLNAEAANLHTEIELANEKPHVPDLALGPLTLGLTSIPGKRLQPARPLEHGNVRWWKLCLQACQFLVQSVCQPPETMTAARSLAGIFAAHTATYAPPPDMPSTENRFRASVLARAMTSAGQSEKRRPGWKSDPPIPGRSAAMTRNPSRPRRSSPTSSGSRREEGVPWKYRTGSPSGLPYSAYASLRPSGRMVSFSRVTVLHRKQPTRVTRG